MIAVTQKTVDSATDFIAVAEAAKLSSRWGEFAIAEIPEIVATSRHDADTIQPPLTSLETTQIVERVEEFSIKTGLAYSQNKCKLALRCKAYIALLLDHLRVSNQSS